MQINCCLCIPRSRPGPFRSFYPTAKWGQQVSILSLLFLLEVLSLAKAACMWDWITLETLPAFSWNKQFHFMYRSHQFEMKPRLGSHLAFLSSATTSSFPGLQLASWWVFLERGWAGQSQLCVQGPWVAMELLWTECLCLYVEALIPNVTVCIWRWSL